MTHSGAFARRGRMDCERVDRIRQFGRKRLVDQAVPLETALADKGRRDQIHTEMGLPSRPVASVAGVEMRFIHYAEALRRKCAGKLFFDPLLNGHRAATFLATDVAP